MKRPAVVILASVLIAACTGQPVVTPVPPAGTMPQSSVLPTPDVTESPTATPAATPAPSASIAKGPPPTPAEPTPVGIEYRYEYQEYDVPAGSHPHDVAPAPDGTVWYTGQNVGRMGRLDPETGEIVEVELPGQGVRRRTV